jgi:hypothetical protein
MKATACCLMVLCSVNPPIGEALSGHAKQRNVGAGGVINAKFDFRMSNRIKLGCDGTMRTERAIKCAAG